MFKGWGMVWVGGVPGGWYDLILFCFYLCFSFSVLFCLLKDDDCCVCFLGFTLFSLSLVSLIRCYYCIETFVSLLWNYLKSQVSDYFSVNYLEKGECFDFNHSLESWRYTIHHHQTSIPSLSFQLADLLPPPQSEIWVFFTLKIW